MKYEKLKKNILWADLAASQLQELKTFIDMRLAEKPAKRRLNYQRVEDLKPAQ